MFSLSNIIIRSEKYPIEIEKLIEANMALVFAKLISFFFKLRVGGWNCDLTHASKLLPKSIMLW